MNMTERRTRGLVDAAMTALVSLLCFSSSLQANKVGSYLYSWYDPAVIYNDAASKTVLRVATTGSDVARVEVQLGSSTEWSPLYDDATHGDSVADDGIYALDGITSDSLQVTHATLWFGGTHSWYAGARAIRIAKKTGAVQTVTGWTPSIGLVDTSQSFPATKVGAGLYATEYVLGIVDKAGKVLDAKIPLGRVRCGYEAFGAFQKLYSVYPDVFDIVVVMPAGTIYDPSRKYAENVPYEVSAKNDVRNIGLPLFDDTAKFFSEGRLREMVYHSFDYGAILDHESGHGWSAWNFGLDQGITDGVHWEENTDIGGQMVGFVFVSGRAPSHLSNNGDGTWRLVPESSTTETFAAMDLYLMGLAPSSSVPPVHRLINPDYSDPEHVTAERVETYTIQQLIDTAGGPRKPAAKDSPHRFNMAFIVVKNKPFTPAEYAWFSLVARYFASDAKGEHYLTPFKAATRGKGSLNARLPAPATKPQWEPK